MGAAEKKNYFVSAAILNAVQVVVWLRRFVAHFDISPLISPSEL
jgi:hypothetical protein